MQIAKDIAKVLLLVALTISVAAVSTFACLRLHQWGNDEAALRATVQSQTQQAGNATRDAVRGVASAAVTAVAQIGGAAASVRGAAKASTRLVSTANDSLALTTHRLDDACPTPSQVSAAWQECGSLATLDQTLGAVSTTSAQAGFTLHEFNLHEATYFGQEAELYTTALDAAQKFEAAVSDPNIGKTVANVQQLSADGAGIVRDGHTWLHAKLYPTKKKGALNALDAAGDHAHHWMPSIF
jgi:hypothetical protein